MSRTTLNRTATALAAAAIAFGALVAVVEPAHGASVDGDGPGAAYFEKGRALLAEGHAAEGFRLVAVAVAIEPGNIPYQTYLLAYVDQADYNADLGLLEDLHRLAPLSTPLMQRLAKLYDGKQRHAEAEALYLKWAELRPDQPEPYARLGEHYYFTGRYDKALAAFARHRALVGESDYAMRRMALVRHEMGDATASARGVAPARVPGRNLPGGVALATPGTRTR
jgi:tetratricopeptide (TPR) repeat protein